MRKTLLLVFIHGFKGGDDTFGTFPEHLRALVSHALPNVDVLAVRYPKFETRGDLKECVTRFREWLQDRVIDIEVSHSTPSPTVDPSVHTVLVGHSMGGIVAVEALLLLASEQPIPVTASSATNPETPNFPSNTTLNSATSTSRPNPGSPFKDANQKEGGGVGSGDSMTASFMFPHIQGILAFDTPFLGLAPGMVAHGVEGGHKMASNAYNTVNEMASIFGWGSKSDPNLSTADAGGGKKALAALPASGADAAAAPKWQSWGKYAMFAGAAGAVAAGGAAALYSQRDKISAGWGWASGHLLFIGDLARAEYLRKRVENVENACHERGLGLANCYTNLGKGAREGYGITNTVAGSERTFCNLPVRVREARDRGDQDGENEVNQSIKKMKWIKSINEKAKDETMAHVSMFFPRDNPGFYALSDNAKEIVVSWVDMGWYNSSDAKKGQPHHADRDDEDDEGDWETSNRREHHENDLEANDYDYHDYKDDDDDVQMRDEVLDKDEEELSQSKEMGGSVIVDKSGQSQSQTVA